LNRLWRANPTYVPAFVVSVCEAYLVLNRIVFVALLAGAIAGLVASGLQQTMTVPLILIAEGYEREAVKDAGAHAGAGHTHDDASTAAGADYVGPPRNTPSPFELQRAAITTVATIGSAVGFALMLLAAMQATGETISFGSALAWGLAGFAATGLAPAFGLAPELPGAASGDVPLRQLWWAATAVATAFGLWLMIRHRTSWAVALGALLLLAPHVIGAPQARLLISSVPAELAAAFAARSLVVQAVLWSLLGGLSGYFWTRGDPGAAS
jgi:cobalt transporter subunit CbtA